MDVKPVARRWRDPGYTCVVAAPGPSLSEDIAEQCRVSGCDVIVVQDAYKRMPWAPILYGCDSKWWKFHRGVPGYAGEKWTAHSPHNGNDKQNIAGPYNLNLVAGKPGASFSVDPGYLCYGGDGSAKTGSNSGFQAAGLAILFGAARVVLVGFDMRHHGGLHHFFGNHPTSLHNPSNYSRFIGSFTRASEKMPPGVTIINATPGSALTCFPMMPLGEALKECANDVAA